MFDLSGSLSITDAEALVQYEGVNRSLEPVFITHLVTDRKKKALPNAAYAFLSSDERQLNLLLGQSPLPVVADVPYSVVPLFKKVSPGEKITGEVRLPVPADEWNAYEPPVREVETKLVTVQEVVLNVKVIPESKAIKPKPTITPPGYWLVGGSSILSRLVLVPDKPLSVRKRLDVFPRS